MNNDQVTGIVRAYVAGIGGYLSTILVGSFGMTGELSQAWSGLITITISTGVAVWSWHTNK